MIARYITHQQIAAFEADGWNVEQLAGHHGRFYLAWRDE